TQGRTQSAEEKSASPNASNDASADAKTATAAGTETKPAAPITAAVVGQPAPDFELTDTEGKAHKLSDHQGKLVVLEWFNPGCPFVKYAHGSGPLKDMAAKEIEQGVVWYSVNSGAPGKQGAGVEGSKEGAKTFGITNPILVDEAGTVGRSYGAEKTPHVFLVDTKGTLVYAGAIDNAPMGEVDGGGPVVNYLGEALAAVRANKPVATAETKSYGCSVKYAKG
ncbi:MAG TPA: redoxin domain-containing protein, partial [Nannocystaceae bacterium]|nr:redoxin domain-containing protein [Nannocystaceae bacterium]